MNIGLYSCCGFCLSFGYKLDHNSGGTKCIRFRRVFDVSERCSSVWFVTYCCIGTASGLSIELCARVQATLCMRSPPWMYKIYVVKMSYVVDVLIDVDQSGDKLRYTNVWQCVLIKGPCANNTKNNIKLLKMVHIHVWVL